MKKIYSTILLLSFLVGTIQPILPMMEYYLSESTNIISLFVGNVDSTSDESMCIAVEMDAPAEQQNEDFSLLNIDYYPIPVKSSEENGLAILPVMGEKFIDIPNKLIHLAGDPSSPPPKTV